MQLPSYINNVATFFWFMNIELILFTVMLIAKLSIAFNGQIQLVKASKGKKQLPFKDFTCQVPDYSKLLWLNDNLLKKKTCF